MTDITGSWDATASTPMGPQVFLLELASDGDVISGTATRDGVTMPLHDGHRDGDTASFSVPMEKPMKLTLAFTLTVSDDTMNGTAKAGFLPAFSVDGRRRG